MLIWSVVENNTATKWQQVIQQQQQWLTRKLTSISGSLPFLGRLSSNHLQFTSLHQSLHHKDAKMALNKEIEYVKWYRRRKLVFHGYVFPFIIMYSVIFYAWLFIYGALEHFELGCISLAITGALQVLTCLFCHWSVHVRCALTCNKVRFCWCDGISYRLHSF